VLLAREDINLLLAIILLCFTAGIGLIIYLMIYYSQSENRCIHCGSIVSSQSPGDIPQIKSSQLQTTEVEYNQEYQNQVVVSQEPEKQKYCQFCGEQLEEDAQFCQGCGAKVH